MARLESTSQSDPASQVIIQLVYLWASACPQNWVILPSSPSHGPSLMPPASWDGQQKTVAIMKCHGAFPLPSGRLGEVVFWEDDPATFYSSFLPCHEPLKLRNWAACFCHFGGSCKWPSGMLIGILDAGLFPQLFFFSINIFILT